MECFSSTEHPLHLLQIMSNEWAKYRKILEREDEEFKKAMEAEVSILLCPRF